jgi:hypothetical protein
MIRRVRRLGLFFAFMLVACSATDFSKQGTPATTDGGVVIGPDGGVIVEDGGRDGGSGPLDCAKIQPAPT